MEIKEEKEKELTVGKVLLVQEISKHVLPTAPSPTVTHLMNLEALIVFESFLPQPQKKKMQSLRSSPEDPITHPSSNFSFGLLLLLQSHICMKQKENPGKEQDFHKLKGEKRNKFVLTNWNPNQEMHNKNENTIFVATHRQK